jgi:hypothetical protein
MTTTRAGAVAVLFAIAISTGGCGSTRPADSSSPTTLPPPTKQSPEQATLAWFSAVDHKDKAEAVADFEPSAADQMNWGNGDTSTWPTFSAIHCKPLQQSASSASIYCTFAESQAAAVGNPDTFWTVHLQRQPDHRWLIAC